MSDFDKVITHILLWEGGYVDHPRDPGGATNMGITFRTLQHYRGKPVTKQDVKDLTVQEAKAIYKKNYWDAVWADQMPDGLDYVMMDAAVNSGPRAAVKWLQRALRVSADGVLGPQTMGAVRATQDVRGLCLKVVDNRERFLRRLRTWNTFGRGWLNRLNHVREVVNQWR